MSSNDRRKHSKAPTTTLEILQRIQSRYDDELGLVEFTGPCAYLETPLAYNFRITKFAFDFPTLPRCSTWSSRVIAIDTLELISLYKFSPIQ